MNPNLPSSPIASGALPLPVANPSASPEAALPNLAPPAVGVNPPPVFNQAPINQLSPPLPAHANQAPLNVVLPPSAPIQMGALPQAAPGVPPALQAINPPALPAMPMPAQVAALPPAAQMPVPLAAVPPHTLGNIAPAPALGNVLAPQPAQSSAAPAPEEMIDRKIFTNPFVILLMISSILILIAGLFFWSYIRTP